MSKGFEEDQMVKVIKAPAEAPHLLGMVGEVAYAWRECFRVYVNDAFTDFRKDEIEALPKKAEP